MLCAGVEGLSRLFPDRVLPCSNNLHHELTIKAAETWTLPALPCKPTNVKAELQA